MLHCSKLCFCPGAEARDAPARGRNQQTLLLFPLGRLDKHTRSPFQLMQKYSLSLIQNTRRIFLAAPHSPSTLVYFAASVGKINSAWCNKNNGSAGLQFMSDFIMPNLRATIDTMHTRLCQNAAFNKNRKHAFLRKSSFQNTSIGETKQFSAFILQQNKILNDKHPSSFVELPLGVTRPIFQI
jgi:hypothetical protein